MVVDMCKEPAQPVYGAVASSAETPTTDATTWLLNTSGARSSAAILSIIAQQERWAEVNAGGRGDVFWVVSPEDLERRLTATRQARISHIPGFHALCKKAPFALLMRAHGCVFFPATILVPPGVPLPAQEIAVALAEGPLIMKPDDGTQGDGIHLLCSREEASRKLEAARSASLPQMMVLQRYLRAPMLLDGHKFDLRL
jgi:hypothetical protein